jgi:hypothetical protein
VLRAGSQSDPGPAVWDDGKPKAFTGTIFTHPYPLILADASGSEPPKTFLLVELGKHGTTRTEPFDGSRVSLSGWTLDRDGRSIVELEPGDQIIKPAAGTTAPETRSVIAASIALRGEILDSKCYLGAMKPGEGKAHKACASLCIRGGIPPMLVVRDGPHPRYVLLTDAVGGPLPESALDFVADEVEILGELELVNGLEVLKVANIRRL